MGGIQLADHAGHPIQARFGALFAAARQHLHADAYAQYRNLVFGHAFDRDVVHAGTAERIHSVVECAHARQDQLGCARQVLGGAGNGHGHRHAAVHIGKRQDVAQAVVNNGDHRKSLFSRPTFCMTVAPSPISAFLLA
ncbi:hypothetical protein D3C85_1211440 [compost metagenome]